MVSYFAPALTRLGVLTAHPVAFIALVCYVVAWAAFDRQSFDWQSVATVTTLLMTLFIQRAEHRDTQAIHAKLDVLAGFSPNFTFLFVVRALLGFGMGAEWPAGAALAMESWPARSRGFMSGVLQGSWGLGFALSALAYGLLYTPLENWHKGYGWRGMLILGVLPALACVWIRMYVKEPEVWAENRKIQDTSHKQVSLPLFAIFKRKYLFNTLTGCLWMAANFCVYYAIWAMLGTYLQKELHWTPAQVSVPVFWGNIITFLI